MQRMDINNLNQWLYSVGQLTNSILWIRDASMQKQLYISPSFENIFGLEVQQLYQQPDSWSDPLHEVDRKSIQHQLKQRKQNQLKNIDDFSSIFYRVILPNSDTRYIKDTGFPVRNASGEIVGFYGIAESLDQEIWAKVKESYHNLQSRLEVQVKDSIQLITDQLITVPNAMDASHSLRERIKFILANELNISVTNREFDCLLCLFDGKTAKESARILNISPRTVEAHLVSIKQKLNCTKKIEILHLISKYL